jgi:SAM-dependent methyltransferase
MPRAKPIPIIHPFDKEHGTDTSGLLAADVIARDTTAPPDELTAYYGVAPSILEALIDVWLQRASPAHTIDRYTFLDVGAGKGRALLIASEHPFAAVEGIELNPALAAIAEKNIALWERDPRTASLAPITLHHADATTHPLPRTPVVAFLFHPFEEPVLRRFLRHVETHLAHHPHAFDLVYVNAEYGSVLDLHPAFEQVWEGRVAMSTEDHIADLAAIAQQREYGSTGDEFCMIYRFTGRSKPTRPKIGHPGKSA